MIQGSSWRQVSTLGRSIFSSPSLPGLTRISLLAVSLFSARRTPSCFEVAPECAWAGEGPEPYIRGPRERSRGRSLGRDQVAQEQGLPMERIDLEQGRSGRVPRVPRVLETPWLPLWPSILLRCLHWSNQSARVAAPTGPSSRRAHDMRCGCHWRRAGVLGVPEVRLVPLR